MSLHRSRPSALPPFENAFASSGRYTCSKCSSWNKDRGFQKGDKKRRKASFNAWDHGVLARLDSYVANAFPFVLSRKSGVAKTVVARLADDLLNGKGFSATSKFISEAYMNTYMAQHQSYVSLVNRCRRSVSEQLRVAAGEVAGIPPFGGFCDREGFNGATPSDAYLRAVWYTWFYDTPVVQVCLSLHMAVFGFCIGAASGFSSSYIRSSLVRFAGFLCAFPHQP